MTINIVAIQYNHIMYIEHKCENTNLHIKTFIYRFSTVLMKPLFETLTSHMVKLNLISNKRPWWLLCLPSEMYWFSLYRSPAIFPPPRNCFPWDQQITDIVMDVLAGQLWSHLICRSLISTHDNQRLHLGVKTEKWATMYAWVRE